MRAHASKIPYVSFKFRGGGYLMTSETYTVRARKVHCTGSEIETNSEPRPNSEAKSEPPNRLSEASENTRPTREDSDIGLQIWCLLHTSTTQYNFATHSPRRSATAMTYQLSRVTTQKPLYISAPGRQVHHFLLLVALVFWGHMNMDCA